MIERRGDSDAVLARFMPLELGMAMLRRFASDEGHSLAVFVPIAPFVGMGDPTGAEGGVRSGLHKPLCELDAYSPEQNLWQPI
jgi:hypothetical protein